MNSRFQAPITVATVLCTLVSALILLYQRGDFVDPEDHARFVGGIKELSRKDTLLNEQTLQLRAGFLHHYDPVVETINAIREELILLDALPPPVTLRDKVQVQARIEEIRFLLESKFEIIEGFKSANALLVNSQRYFPGALERAFHSSVNQTELQASVLDLAVAAVRWLLHGDRNVELAGSLTAAANEGNEDAESQRNVRLLLDQVNRLISSQDTTVHQIARILELPTQLRLHELETSVNFGYGKVVARAEKHRVYLYTLCGLILSYALYTGIGLFRASRDLHLANLHLEERVEKRTAQLRQKNDELECEVLERKRTEEQLQRANKELDEFSYIASHDLQEPLRKLVAFSDLLREDLGDDLNTRAEEDLFFIKEASNRMQTLVRDLLELSRTDKRNSPTAEIHLDACLDEALDALASRISETGAEITRQPLPIVEGDRTLITQLFQNLIGNALKFMREGTTPRIDVGFRWIGRELAFFVADNGIGIEPKHAESIFSPFQRLHGRDSYEGTGIGLAICSKAVERHGGRIWVESTPGEGSSFLFTLPVNQDAEALKQRVA